MTTGTLAGFFSAIAAITTLPLAISSTCPERYAAMVELLSSKRLITAPLGATALSSMSSIEPRVTLMVLPAIASIPAMATSAGPNTAR